MVGKVFFVVVLFFEGYKYKIYEKMVIKVLVWLYFKFVIFLIFNNSIIFNLLDF